jgi:hypothetical protein
MAIRALNSVIVANYNTAANASWQAGACLMLNASGLVEKANRNDSIFNSLVKQTGRFVGFSSDDTARTGNTMILADPLDLTTSTVPVFSNQTTTASTLLLREQLAISNLKSLMVLPTFPLNHLVMKVHAEALAFTTPQVDSLLPTNTLKILQLMFLMMAVHMQHLHLAIFSFQALALLTLVSLSSLIQLHMVLTVL